MTAGVLLGLVAPGRPRTPGAGRDVDVVMAGDLTTNAPSSMAGRATKLRGVPSPADVPFGAGPVPRVDVAI